MAKMSAFKVEKIKTPGFHRDGGDGAARGLYLQVAKTKAGGLTKSCGNPLSSRKAGVIPLSLLVRVGWA